MAKLDGILNSWVILNAILHSFLIFYSLVSGSVLVYVVFIVLMHLFLFFFDLNSKERLVPNLITFIRLLHLPFLYYFKFDFRILAFIIVMFLILDGLDGFLARRLNVASIFGEFLDKELDASFVSLVTVFIALESHLYYFFLVGILRYIYVLICYGIKVLKALAELPDYSSKVCRYLFIVFMSCLVLGFYFSMTSWGIYMWGLAFLALLISYAISFSAVLFKTYDT
tara:strand:+ start:1385 stop:2062 length:678 start_codon:yes stop_codon:yes gene_type:complete